MIIDSIFLIRHLYQSLIFKKGILLKSEKIYLLVTVPIVIKHYFKESFSSVCR
jgi:hypothetical protein